MSTRQVTETFPTIDEDGNQVIVTRVRYLEIVRKSDGELGEYESGRDLRVDGEAVIPVEDDPVFRYRTSKTGKKLRLP